MGEIELLETESAAPDFSELSDRELLELIAAELAPISAVAQQTLELLDDPTPLLAKVAEGGGPLGGVIAMLGGMR